MNPARTAGLFDTMQAMAATLGRGLQTRFELAVVDLESERDRLLRRMTLLLVSIVFGAVGLVLRSERRGDSSFMASTRDVLSEDAQALLIATRLQRRNVAARWAQSPRHEWGLLANLRTRQRTG